MNNMDLGQRRSEAMKWDGYAMKLKLAGSLIILFLTIFVVKAAGLIDSGGPAMVFAMFLGVGSIIVWRIWIGRYCAKKRDSVLGLDNEELMRRRLLEEMLGGSAGKNGGSSAEAADGEKIVEFTEETPGKKFM